MSIPAYISEAMANGGFYLGDLVIVKCLFCKSLVKLVGGETFEDYLKARKHKCKECGQEGLMRDVVGEAEVREEVREEEEALQADQAEWREACEFRYPVPLHVFQAEYSCPWCGSKEFTVPSGWRPRNPNGRVVGCTPCQLAYEWPCVDIRELDSPGETGPLSPRDEEARLRKIMDDNLREVFG